MALWIDVIERKAIEQAKRDIFLGLITADERVRLRVADAVNVPGHVEWLLREPGESVIGGFSVLVRDGRVWAIFPRSRLNTSDDARLADDRINELVRLLPVSESVKILE